MNVKTSAEKEWLRKLTTGKPVEKKEQTAPIKVATEKENKRPERNDAHGFRDVAGMDELKQLVTEGFINVLNNQECAKAFGITPPSLLFYGPAGCGKTFFAEKMAEEVGINFMKIVPDDLASTLVHGTQEKIGQTFKHVTATCEFFYSGKKSLTQNLEKSLELLGVVRTVFRNDMEELS